MLSVPVQPVAIGASHLGRIKPCLSESVCLHCVRKRIFPKAMLRKERDYFAAISPALNYGYTVPAVETLEKFARALEVRRVSSSAEIASPG